MWCTLHDWWAQQHNSHIPSGLLLTALFGWQRAFNGQLYLEILAWKILMSPFRSQQRLDKLSFFQLHSEPCGAGERKMWNDRLRRLVTKHVCHTFDRLVKPIFCWINILWILLFHNHPCSPLWRFQPCYQGQLKLVFLLPTALILNLHKFGSIFFIYWSAMEHWLHSPWWSCWIYGGNEKQSKHLLVHRQLQMSGVPPQSCPGKHCNIHAPKFRRHEMPKWIGQFFCLSLA